MTNFVRASVAVAALLILAACQSDVSTVSASGENGAGVPHLREIRAEAGMPALLPDAALEKAALQQASFMAGAGAMKHTTGLRRAFDQRMRQNGVTGAAAENIAHGAFGADELFRRWMRSPPHRRNMLDRSYTRFGLAAASDPRGGSRRYWALILAR